MIANLLTVTLVVVSAAWTNAAAARNWVPPYAGVDPNTLACDAEGLVFLLLPHFTACNKFYTCDHGNEVEMECPSPLIFDFEKQTCNWDWDTKCWLRNREEEIEGSGSGTELEWAWNEPSIASSHASPVKESPFSSALDCTKVESAHRLLANKKDCQRYWRCSNGVAETAFCTDGLFFNEAKQQCDFEANVRCDQAEELGSEFIAYN